MCLSSLENGDVDFMGVWNGQGDECWWSGCKGYELL